MATATEKKPKSRIEDLDLRDIPEDHAAILRTLVGEQNMDAALPDGVVKNYWEWKRIADRGGVRPTPGDLVTIAFLAGHGRPFIDELQTSIPTLFKNKKLNHGDPLEGIWKNKLTAGQFQGMAANGSVLMLFEGEVDVRQIDASKVFLPRAEAE